MADIVDLHHPSRPVEQAPQMHHDLERATQQLQGAHPDMLAFVVFAISPDGQWSTRHSIGDETSILGPRMLSAMACEGIRENLVTARCVSEMASDGEI